MKMKGCKILLPASVIPIALVLGVPMGLRSDALPEHAASIAASILSPLRVIDLRSALSSTYPGNSLTIRDFTAQGGRLFFLLSGNSEQDWRILNTDGDGAILDLVNLSPGYYEKIAVRDSGEIALYRPSKDAYTVLLIDRAGREVTSYGLRAPLHSMCIVGGQLVTLLRDGTVAQVAADPRREPRALIGPRVPLTGAPVGLLGLASGRLAAWNRATAELTLLDLSSGSTAHYRLKAPEIDSAIGAYAAQRERFAEQRRPGEQLMTGLAVPACAAAETGNIFALVSPYSFSEGARVVEFTEMGQPVRSFRCKLPSAAGGRGGPFSPGYLGVAGGKLILVDPRGPVGVYLP